MDLDKSFVNGSIPLLVMKLLEEKDLYGYQMIEEIRLQSADALHLKAGTLYPLLHGMKEKGFVTAYEQAAVNGKSRRYYHLTDQGRTALQEKEASWKTYVRVVGQVLKFGDPGSWTQD